MLDWTLCIMIASGYERQETPAKQNERLDFLLSSVDKKAFTRVVVVDDFSNNLLGQRSCEAVCESYGVEYILNPGPWKGPCGNYNFAVRNCKTEYIAMLGDDQYCSRDWFVHMAYFIENNPQLNWGMLGWSVIFADDLINIGYLRHRSDFYLDPEKIRRLNVGNLPRAAVANKWCNWDRPRYRGCCSGTAFVVRKTVWEQLGGFFEEIYQFDEDYGDNCWVHLNLPCIQVPTPPIFHYGGACGWPKEKEAGDIRWREGWKRRPFVPVDFAERGAVADKIIQQRGMKELDNLDYLPFNAFTKQELSLPFGLILDLGCGTNLRHPEAIGVDLIPMPVSKAQVVCNLGFEKLPFPNNSCGLVLAHDILEHIPHVVWESDVRKTPSIFLFNEVYRVLRDGGIFEIAVPFYPNGEVFQDPTHASFWTPDTFNYFCNTYHGLKELYGHTSTFQMVTNSKHGAHYHVRLVADKTKEESNG